MKPHLTAQQASFPETERMKAKQRGGKKKNSISAHKFKRELKLNVPQTVKD